MDNFKHKAVNYLASTGLNIPKGTNVLELMGICPLIYPVNGNRSLTLVMLRDWGTQLGFIV